MSTNTMISITSPDDISLKHHGLIEASAGTGKTYTIENLVLRILLKEEFDLSEILLVTFTEKATGELKSRIRSCIQKTLKSQPISKIQRLKLIKNIRLFDQAPIFTIHGFCQQVSSEYSFENRTPLVSNIVSSETLFEEAFHYVIQNKFESTFKHHSNFILQFISFEKWLDRNPISKKHCLYQKLLSIFYGIENSDQVLVKEQSAFDIETIIKELNSIYQDFISLIPILKQDLSDPAIDQLTVLQKTKISKFINDIISNQINPTNSLSILKSIVIPKTKVIDTKWTKITSNPSAFQQVRELNDQLTSLLAHIYFNLVSQIQDHLQFMKIERSQIVFHDMLVRLNDALIDPSFGLDLRNKLQSKYKLALVDEFQDTDPIQWNIFKTIFMDEAKDNRLLLVGDPKQAIYLFRGGDINTYLEAKTTIEDLSKKDQAKIYSLSTNYRSATQLIDIFNKSFSPEFGSLNSLWFVKDDQLSKNITYNPVNCPPDYNLQTVINDGRSALNLINVEKEDSNYNADDCSYRWMQYIKNEISYLYHSSPLVYQKREKDKQAISLNDICILTRTAALGEEMEQILLNADIPVSYYKRKNLYSNEIAYHLELLFRAFIEPNFGNKNALRLTPFFDLTLENEEQSDYNFDLFLNQCYQLLKENKWGLFKEKLLIETAYLQRYSTKIDFDFRFSILSQILEELESLAYTENLDFSMVLSRLKKFRRDGSGGEDLHRLATEKPKVQIMTMHVSKGLEFPIVFVLDKFSFSKAKATVSGSYFDSKLSKRILNLDPTYESELQSIQEIDEIKRLYYVALTRASLRLYLPLCSHDEKKNKGTLKGWFSTRMNEVFPQGSENVSYFNYSHMQFKDEASNQPTKETIGLIDFQIPKNHKYKSIIATSYSSISRKLKGIIEQKESQFKPLDDKSYKQDEDIAIETNLKEESLSYSLPKGAVVGTMLHEIFEETDFTMVSNTDELPPSTFELIQSKLKFYNFDQNFTNEVESILKHTLHSKIPQVAKDFTLSTLTEHNKLVEADFWIPSEFYALLNIKSSAEYTRGAIDLIFRHNAKFYILDWKSNSLDNYEESYLNEKMIDTGYDLQYMIYSWCFLRWAKLRIKNFNDDMFGGVIYCFLRGMKSNQSEGIFFKSGNELGNSEQILENIYTKIKVKVAQ
ncbi:MAG: hypothetical protein COB02_17325 [Candidatus Cloacimonadota bacterium]|nr:MAG: hypothetical protein COB02_17325 [Candidatus Cloacimonadota bacterium]